MGINSDACKQAIVEHCRKHHDRVAREFDPPLDQDGLDLTYKTSNWKRMSKEKSEAGGVVRAFNCLPLDDQLRAYVESSPGDEEIVGLTVQGE